MPQVEYEDIISGEGALNKDLNDKEGGKTGIKFYVGDVLYGKLRPYLMNWLYPQFNGVAVGDFWVLRATECDSSFLYRLVQTDGFQRLANVSSGSKMPRADWNLISQSFFAVPANHAEQKAIAKSLAELDSLITLHQRKYDKLAQLKKSMLDKMFPKPGERFPEIRFAGFTDPWEQRKLGELMDVASVRRVHQEDWTDEGVRFLRARDLVAFAKNESIEDPLFISSEMYKEYSAQSGKVSVGDLLVTGVGTIGVPWLVTSDNPVYFKDGNIIWFKNRHSIDGGFFYHSFTASAIQNYINEAAGIGTIGTYTIETGKKTPIWLPSRQEQREIAAMMTHLDTLITLHQRECQYHSLCGYLLGNSVSWAALRLRLITV